MKKHGMQMRLFAVIMSVILFVTSGLFGVDRVVAASNPDSIDWLIEKSILNNDFDLDAIKEDSSRFITREEFIALIVSAAGMTESDVKEKELSYVDGNKTTKALEKYIRLASRWKITPKIKDTGATYLKPTSVLTKQMAAYYLARYYKLHIDLELEEFQDFDRIGTTCKPYVTAMVKYGMMQGETTNKFKPSLKMSWKMAADLIQKAYDAGWFELKSVSVVLGLMGQSDSNSVSVLNGVSGISQCTKDGILYLADTNHNQIKAVVNGKVEVIAGQDLDKDEKGRTIGGYVDGACEKALFQSPTGICTTQDGIYVVDTGNNAIRYINLEKKTVTTYAGTGEAGADDGIASKASFSKPTDIAVAEDGTIYIADTGNHCIRKIDSYGEVTTVAGNSGKAGYHDGGVNTALFNQPTGIAIAGSTIYVADCGNQRIRMISNGKVTTYAGTSRSIDVNSNEFIGGFQNGSVEEAMFCYPSHLTIDAAGSIYVADTGNHMIRKIEDGEVTTVAGFGVGVNQTEFQWENYCVQPNSLCISKDQNCIYVTDSFLNLVLQIPLEGGFSK